MSFEGVDVLKLPRPQAERHKWKISELFRRGRYAFIKLLMHIWQ